VLLIGLIIVSIAGELLGRLKWKRKGMATPRQWICEAENEGATGGSGFGGPGEIRTLDLFHAMEARSQLRHRPTGRFQHNISVRLFNGGSEMLADALKRPKSSKNSFLI
jgi:hypothetical protein